MSGASPNVSLNSFSFAKYYDGLALQMGVPVLDSDWNEQNDIRRIQEIIVNKAIVGNTKLATDYGGTQPYGFDLYQATSHINNFAARAGWAMVEGVLVPTTVSTPPTALDYTTQVMFTGTVSSIGGPATYIVDSSKAFLTGHYLVGCRLIPTSGPAIGLTFVISALTGSTQLSLTGGVGAIVAGNTYEIRPPALTTPGAARIDPVYLMVWFDDINDVEDPSIVNPGVAVETCHRVKRSWCMRVAEGSTTPANTNADIYGFGPRYLEIGHFDRLSGDSSIHTAMITSNAGTHSLGSLCSENVYFDPTNTTSHGFTAPTDSNVELAINAIIESLASTSATLGSYLVKSKAVAGTPDSLTIGSVASQLAELIGRVNSRVKNPNQNTAVMLLASGPQLVWRSHNITGDANVTKDTVSWYVAQNATINTNGSFIIVCGGYLSGAYCYKAPAGTAPTRVTMTMFTAGSSIFATKTSLSTPWRWDSLVIGTAWDKYASFDSSLEMDSMDLNVHHADLTLHASRVELLDKDAYVRPRSVTYPRRVVTTDDSVTPGVVSQPGIWQSGSATYITQNCYWNPILSLWFAYNTALAATAVSVSSSGLTVYTKAADHNMAAGWPETTVGWNGDYWTSSLNIGDCHTWPIPDRTRAGISASGGTYEMVMFAASIEAPSAGAFGLWCPISFRSYRATAPNIDIVIEHQVNVSSDFGTYHASDVPEWGGYVHFSTDAIAADDSAWILGYVLATD